VAHSRKIAVLLRATLSQQAAIAFSIARCSLNPATKLNQQWPIRRALVTPSNDSPR